MEAALIANRIPPGWHRNFAFMDWPCFKPTRWTHIRREAEKDRTHVETPLIFASDKSPDACRSFEDAIRGMDFAGAIAIVNRNFLDLLPTDAGVGTGAKRRGMIVINPPYGRRIETKEESDRLFKEICRKLKRDFTGWKLALIARDREVAAQVPFPVNVRELLHGGLRLLLLSGRIS
jgi:putative N6-adenine-specific DNA methylase